jgi:predicted lactoylglutathione lyase
MEITMSATQTASLPTIRNAGTRPITPRKLFVNIPVSDLQRSIDFFESLGFAFNTQFTDASATCMLVGEDAYFMLLTRDKFQDFSKRPTADATQATNALYAFSVNSRAEVDDIVHRAFAAGGLPAHDPRDHGFMYQWSFFDLDGHHWEVFWMDPAAVNG